MTCAVRNGKAQLLLSMLWESQRLFPSSRLLSHTRSCTSVWARLCRFKPTRVNHGISVNSTSLALEQQSHRSGTVNLTLLCPEYHVSLTKGKLLKLVLNSSIKAIDRDRKEMEIFACVILPKCSWTSDTTVQRHSRAAVVFDSSNDF